MNEDRIIAMVHPLALPGRPRYDGTPIGEISEKLIEEVEILVRNGISDMILQNFNDLPVKDRAPLGSASYLTRLASDIKRSFPAVRLGILALWDGVASLVAADASGADYIRVEHVYCGAEMTACGIIEGQCMEVQEAKKLLSSPVNVYADIYEPHGRPLSPLPPVAAAREAVFGGLAEGLFITGKNSDESIAMAKYVKTALPHIPLFCGGGSNPGNVKSLLSVFDKVCVGSFIKDGNLSNPLNEEKLKLYMDSVRA